MSAAVGDAACKFPAGVLMPVVDPARCAAKGPCVTACPYDVLAQRVAPDAIRRGLSALGRVRLLVHGGRQAFAAAPDACRGCGLCVQACPQMAIRLVRQEVPSP